MNKTQKRLILSLFTVYLLVLAWIIVFKMSFSFEMLPNLRNINLIPFGDSTIVNGRVDISEIIYNVLVFVPFGLYMCMINPDWPFWKKAAPILCTSLIFEVLQYVFSIGGSDITDLIGNTLGGICGILLFYMVCRLCKSREKAISSLVVAALAGTVCVCGLMGFILIVSS